MFIFIFLMYILGGILGLYGLNNIALWVLFALALLELLG